MILPKAVIEVTDISAERISSIPGKILGCRSYIISEKNGDDCVVRHSADGWVCKAGIGGDRTLLVGPVDSALPPENMADLTSLAAFRLRSEIGRTQRSEQTQMLIKDYVSSIRSRQLLGVDGLKPYPYDKEKQLIAAISSGDASSARQQLNGILGFIFFSESRDLATIKIRAIELTVLISRAALDAGAEECGIYELCPQFITNIMELGDIEDICIELTEMLGRFMTLTFDRSEVRHRDIISKTVKYVSDNYMHRITLEDTARKIFVSPSYLSRVFSAEMNMSFTEFVSEMRVQKSCLLLRSDNLSISEIASLVGFSDQSYFNKVFKKKIGVTPKQYRDGNE